MGTFVVFDGPPSGNSAGFNNLPTTSPTAGGSVDGCTGGSGTGARFAATGVPIQVKLGGNVSAGDDLETDSSGQAVQHSTGQVVARALEGGSSGEVIWAVFA